MRILEMERIIKRYKDAEVGLRGVSRLLSREEWVEGRDLLREVMGRWPLN